MATLAIGTTKSGRGAKSAEMAYVLVFAPTSTALEEMVEAFGARWTIEQCIEEGKGEAGLDEYEIRSWHGWFRHITLSMVALAFLALYERMGKKLYSKKARAGNSSTRSNRLSSISDAF